MCAAPARGARCPLCGATGTTSPPYGTPGGVTAAWNLRHLSRRCHRAKHHGWALTVHPDGTVTWLSPLGRTYQRPAPHQRPEPTDWTRWQDSPRWTPTGLQLLPAKNQPQRQDSRIGTGAGTDARDQDWDWSHRLAERHREGLHRDPAAGPDRDRDLDEPNDPPPF